MARPVLFRLTATRIWMKTLSYVIADDLVQLFQEADPFDFKGSAIAVCWWSSVVHRVDQAMPKDCYSFSPGCAVNYADC
jgi:hypothetical protein